MFRYIISRIKYCWWWLFASYEQRHWMKTLIRVMKVLQPDIKGRNLEEDLFNSQEIKDKVQNVIYANALYSTLCNNCFTHHDKKGDPWSCSWRYAGGLVADFRDQGEDYLDYYCSGCEGEVNEQIEEDLLLLGWSVVKDEERTLGEE